MRDSNALEERQPSYYVNHPTMPGSDAYPIPSAPTTCTALPSVVERHWRFSQVDPASETRSPRGRVTAWCIQCGEVLEVQEEGTGVVIFSGFPHGANVGTSAPDQDHT